MWHVAVLGMSEQGLNIGVASGSVGHERAVFNLMYGIWQCWGMSEQGLSLVMACGSVEA